jgi:hypothetical protein
VGRELVSRVVRPAGIVTGRERDACLVRLTGLVWGLLAINGIRRGMGAMEAGFWVLGGYMGDLLGKMGEFFIVEMPGLKFGYTIGGKSIGRFGLWGLAFITLILCFYVF